jgi:hypothetical protein
MIRPCCCDLASEKPMKARRLGESDKSPFLICDHLLGAYVGTGGNPVYVPAVYVLFGQDTI